MKMVRTVVFATAFLGLTACNTVKGVGRDIQVAGEVVEEVATGVEEEITN